MPSFSFGVEDGRGRLATLRRRIIVAFHREGLAAGLAVRENGRIIALGDRADELVQRAEPKDVILRRAGAADVVRRKVAHAALLVDEADLALARVEG